MSPKSSSRERILDAAEKVVQKYGASHMTMDAVVDGAGISKGGLIYHFPSLHKLLQAMLDRHIDRVEAQRARISADLPPGPAREIKAFIQGWLNWDEKNQRAAHALLAVVTREPDLLERARKKRLEILTELLKEQPNREFMAILLLAVEGFWMAELLGIAALNQKERKRVERTLLLLADEWAQPRIQSGSPARVRGSNKGKANDGASLPRKGVLK